MGRGFIGLFEGWSATYDDTVLGNDLEYCEVFKEYQQILYSCRMAMLWNLERAQEI